MESINNADIEPIRAVPYTHTLEQMAKTMVFRSLDRKHDALAALETGDGPVPCIGPEWNDSELRGAQIPPSDCRVSTDGSECFVTSLCREVCCAQRHQSCVSLF